MRIAWNQWSPEVPEGEFTDADIWVMGSNGSSQELLFNGPGTDTFPQFTPDGETIVMTAETGDRDIRKIPSTPAVPPLTEATGLAEDNELIETDPSVSPDGSRVAFAQTSIASSGGPFDIYSVGIEGGATTPVYSTAANETSPAYSPDGTKMVFLKGRAADDWQRRRRRHARPARIRPPSFNRRARMGAGAGRAERQLGRGRPGGRWSIGHHTAADEDPEGPEGQAAFVEGDLPLPFDEAASTFKCKLDRRKAAPCRSPKTYRGLKEGQHIFEVFAIDAAGNRDRSPAKRRFTVVEPVP